MYFQQILRDDIGCAAYLVGSNDAGEAAVIDPRIDMVDEILDLVAREGLRLRYVIETHNHADHVSGHHELLARTGATIAVFEDAGVDYPHLALRDGEEIALGEVRLRVIHTPGHRPEHIAIAAIDTSRGPEPWLVMTGDSLFIGDVARPDLAIAGEAGAAALFHTLHDRLLGLPEGTLVYPGHVSGSLCGRVNNRMTGTSIGFERHFNPALAITSEPEFVRYMNENLPERPPNMGRIVELNRGAEAAGVSRPIAFSAEDVRHRVAGGATVLDVRSPEAFSGGHIPGAVGVWLDGSQFQNRVGLVLPAESPLILVTGAETEVGRAAAALAVIGFNRVDGYLAGGMHAWERAGHEVATLPQMTVAELHDLAGEGRVQVLDVRETSEWRSGHVAGSVNVPFYRVTQGLDVLESGKTVAVICGGGERSVLAAGLLRRAGIDPVVNVVGGMDAWSAAGYSVAREFALAHGEAMEGARA